MAKRDLNQRAAEIVAKSVGDAPKPPPPDATATASGAKGGRERAARLTAQRRSEIAREAALARWREHFEHPEEGISQTDDRVRAIRTEQDQPSSSGGGSS